MNAIRKAIYWAIKRSGDELQHLMSIACPRVDIINEPLIPPSPLPSEYITSNHFPHALLWASTTSKHAIGSHLREYSSFVSFEPCMSTSDQTYKEYASRLVNAINNGHLLFGQVTLEDLQNGLNLTPLDVEEAHWEAIKYAQNNVHLGQSSLSSEEGKKVFSMLSKLQDILGVEFDGTSLVIRLINEGTLCQRRGIQQWDPALLEKEKPAAACRSEESS